MAGYYRNLLAKRGAGHQLDLIEFRPNVLERYEGDRGPWKLHRNEPGWHDGILFYYWIRKGSRLEGYKDFATLTHLPFSDGQGPATGFIIAYLKDLASLPLSEQEHWKKYER